MTPPIQGQVALVTVAKAGMKARGFVCIANVVSLAANPGGLQYDWVRHIGQPVLTGYGRTRH